MSEDDAFNSRLLKPAQAYARLYPSILNRLKAAYISGDAAARQVAEALNSAMEQADSQRERRLRDSYGLSPQEIRLTLHLVDGGTVTTCAEQMSVAESTVRSHLKSVFTKTGCRRQSQLPSILQARPKGSDSD